MNINSYGISQIKRLLKQLIVVGYCFCAVILITPLPFSGYEVKSVAIKSASAHTAMRTHIEHTTEFGYQLVHFDEQGGHDQK